MRAVANLHSSLFILHLTSRKEETRTPDPHVPNVVRYQLRYFPSGPKTAAKVQQLIES